MKRSSKIKKFPIVAGMQFTYPGTTNDVLHVVGYYWVKFTYIHHPDNDLELISQKQIKRVFI